MDKSGLLRSIAETGYNVGFGAKKHFATYDMVEKAPGFIGFASIAIGILSLVFDALAQKLPAACLAIAGVCGVYISLYDYRKRDYEEAGKKLTQIYNSLRNLYRDVQADADLVEAKSRLDALEVEYTLASISKQMMFSDWYAHYKFFAEQQIDWVNEQKQFRWTDKVPLSLRVSVIVVAGALIWLAAQHFGLLK